MRTTIELHSVFNPPNTSLKRTHFNSPILTLDEVYIDQFAEEIDVSIDLTTWTMPVRDITHIVIPNRRVYVVQSQEVITSREGHLRVRAIRDPVASILLTQNNIEIELIPESLPVPDSPPVPLSIPSDRLYNRADTRLTNLGTNSTFPNNRLFCIQITLSSDSGLQRFITFSVESRLRDITIAWAQTEVGGGYRDLITLRDIISDFSQIFGVPMDQCVSAVISEFSPFQTNITYNQFGPVIAIPSTLGMTLIQKGTKWCWQITSLNLKNGQTQTIPAETEQRNIMLRKYTLVDNADNDIMTLNPAYPVTLTTISGFTDIFTIIENEENRYVMGGVLIPIVGSSWYDYIARERELIVGSLERQIQYSKNDMWIDIALDSASQAMGGAFSGGVAGGAAGQGGAGALVGVIGGIGMGAVGAFTNAQRTQRGLKDQIELADKAARAGHDKTANMSSDFTLQNMIMNGMVLRERYGSKENMLATLTSLQGYPSWGLPRVFSWSDGFIKGTVIGYEGQHGNRISQLVQNGWRIA